MLKVSVDICGQVTARYYEAVKSGPELHGVGSQPRGSLKALLPCPQL